MNKYRLFYIVQSQCINWVAVAILPYQDTQHSYHTYNGRLHPMFLVQSARRQDDNPHKHRHGPKPDITSLVSPICPWSIECIQKENATPPQAKKECACPHWFHVTCKLQSLSDAHACWCYSTACLINVGMWVKLEDMLLLASLIMLLQVNKEVNIGKLEFVCIPKNTK